MFFFHFAAASARYTDHQRLKLQENPEMVPTGEMPRHISLSLDRYLVDTVKPGTRIQATGVFTTYQKKGMGRQGDSSDSGVRIPYMRALGIQQDNSASDLLSGQLLSPHLCCFCSFLLAMHMVVRACW